MWGHELVDFPELESLEFEIPERSILYRIPAMGEGTGQAEGLLSYLVRLAAEHSVNPRRLVSKVYASSNPELTKLCGAGFFIRHAGTINGLGKYAEIFLDETAKLTGANFLRPMTLLPLKDLLPYNGAGLLVKRPKWCPYCLEEMKRAQGEIFRPLVWSLELYRVCVQHGIRLEEVCCHCGKAQPYIPNYPDWGRCAHCGGMLMVGKAKPVEAKVDRWIATALNNLILHLKDIDGHEAFIRFMAFLEEAALQHAKGNHAALCRLLGLPSWMTKGWFSRSERPTLPHLLSICYGFNVLPSALFMQSTKETIAAAGIKLRTVPGKLVRRAARPLLTSRDRQKLAAQLAKITNNINDTRTVTEVAGSLELSRSCLKYWFPEEYAIVRKRHSEFVQGQALTQLKDRQEKVGEVVRELMLNGIYPGRRRVNAAIERYKFSLASPQLRLVYRQLVKGK